MGFKQTLFAIASVTLVDADNEGPVKLQSKRKTTKAMRNISVIFLKQILFVALISVPLSSRLVLHHCMVIQRMKTLHRCLTQTRMYAANADTNAAINILGRAGHARIACSELAPQETRRVA